jgi:hypothetical protein
MSTTCNEDKYDFKLIKPSLTTFKVKSGNDIIAKKLLDENFWNETKKSISLIKTLLIEAYEEFSSMLRCFVQCLSSYYDLNGKGLIELQKFINVFKGLAYYQFNFISESNSKNGLHFHIHHKVNNQNFVSFAMFKAYLNAITNIYVNLPNNNNDPYKSYKEKLKLFHSEDLTEILLEINEHDKYCKSLIADSKQKFCFFIQKNYAKNCISYNYNSANYVISDGKNKPSKDMIDTVSEGRTLFEGYKHVETFILRHYKAPSIITNERTIKNIFDFHNENDTSFQKRLKNSKKIGLNTVVIDKLIERITDDIVLCDGDEDFEDNIGDDGD